MAPCTLLLSAALLAPCASVSLRVPCTRLPTRGTCTRAAAGMAHPGEAPAEEEDWVQARMAEEDRAFRAQREAAQLARAAAWEEEARRVRAEEARRAGGDEPRATSEAQTRQAALAEYEARVREQVPMGEDEKRAARHREMLRQIEQADAMDERLARKNRDARRRREEGGWAPGSED